MSGGGAPRVTMSSERNLAVLLAELAPVLDPEVYTFAIVSPAEWARLTATLGLFREAEGLTVICGWSEAEALGLRAAGPFRRITLTVHSDLAAVGLTAGVATALAEVGVACNVVAAFHHDHLFVPAAQAGAALTALRGLQDRARSIGPIGDAAPDQGESDCARRARAPSVPRPDDCRANRGEGAGPRRRSPKSPS